MNDKTGKNPNHSLATRLTRVGRPFNDEHRYVNPPVIRASTVLFKDLDEATRRPAKYVYGRRGTPTSRALAEAVSELEGAEGTVICPSGLSAVTTAVLAFVKSGDHVLMPDNAYEPTRIFADKVLSRYGVAVSYYDPAATIEDRFRPETSVVFVEAPGSLTFELPDVPALVAAAHRHGARVVMDNTWATPLFFRPLDHGVDAVAEAGTKYFGGHADLMIGTISASGEAWRDILALHGTLGLFTGPDDMALALRGLRTLALRMARHQASAMAVATWLEARPDVAKVLYPALPSHPQHALWTRDFTGASGLFGFVLDRPYPRAAIAAMVDGLELFGIGDSWGSYESLITVPNPARIRTVTEWAPPGPAFRVSIGLEDPADLIADLAAGFDRLHAAAG
jgi:cystathionine beta-lyase